MMTELKSFSGCQDANSVPEESVRDTVLPAEAESTVTIMTPWVEVSSKFCAMPEDPEAKKIPPLMVASLA